MKFVILTCVGFLVIFGNVFAQDANMQAIIESTKKLELELNDVTYLQKNTSSILGNVPMLVDPLKIGNQQNAIYGEWRAGVKVIYCYQDGVKTIKSQYECDDRVDTLFHESKDLQERARSVAVLIRKNKIEKVGQNFRIKDSTTLGQKYSPLCTEPEPEPFENQIIPGFCTGFLVKNDMLATAGHCVSSITKGAYVVFDFKLSGDGSISTINSSNLYEIKSVGKFSLNKLNGEDWALINLKKPVVGRQPLEIRQSGKVNDKENVCVIGHPAGLPQKIACGAHVTNNKDKIYFTSNLDTYGGNSGSPVFNKNNNIVEGILVRGHKDFENRGGCYSSVICPSINDCQGEDVTRTTLWANHVPKQQIKTLPVKLDQCVEGRVYTGKGCSGGYFENGIYHQPN